MGKRNGSRGEQTTKDVNLLSRISKSIKQVPSYIDYGATIKWIEIDDIWEQYSEENEMIKPYQAVLMDEKIYEQNVVLKWVFRYYELKDHWRDASIFTHNSGKIVMILVVLIVIVIGIIITIIIIKVIK